MQTAEAKGPVRVRVRAGGRIKIGPQEFAIGGDYIELDARDLAHPTIRAQVETEDEVRKAADQATADGAPKVSPAAAEFERLRTSARVHAETTQENREMVERVVAEQTLERLDGKKDAAEPPKGKKK